MSTLDQDHDLSILLTRAADGDRAAFARFYDLTNSRIYGLALRVLHDRSHAEEVVQEAYLQYWQLAHEYDTNRGSVISWMMTIAHRRAVDRIRAEELGRRRGEQYVAANAPIAEPPTLDLVLQNEESMTLRDCLGRLTDLQRSSIELSYFSGMSYPEVAAHTATPLPTIKSRIRDGLRRLRHCVRSDGR
ncbi:RNA polymerase ECF-type sigma factor SigK [Gordonia effusa NBRC 100432]|uniref:RNA polymerase ECF-type sigma factor SigK n=1 Tax=Gordonia effusa NBRC 100432 TaxID=1077974 RepID=H0R469_9ACTN|nr:sigma-70 family RNA polymerase sigma factor [Gordonia effusa]GAB19870.1 RNA polymerase ECF-type sigma factor SigK [Gordonia effusa NBRC 100432]